MKCIRVYALVLAVVMLTGCAVPAQPAATVAPTVQTIPTESTVPETETAGTQTAPTQTDPPETEPPQTQPPTPLSELADSDLVRIADYIPNIVQELAYATEENFTGKVVYEFTDAYLRCGTVKKLIKAQEILNEQGLGLKIWDGFRPVYAQAKLFDAWPDPNYVSHPVTGYRAHCRGNAADVTLIDLESGEELDMPTGFDDFSARADRNYADCTQEQAENARILESAMAAAGFTPYSAEWWHFTDPVSYPVDEYFDPAVISTWAANCEEFINLRAAPSSDAQSVARIPDGDTFTLLGWTHAFAYVSWQGLTGFVLSSYIIPVDGTLLDIVQPTDTYSYAQMTADIAELAAQYPQIITVSSIGASEEGRDIPVLLLGDPEAEKHILVQGTVHALEHMCSWLLMAMTEAYAAAGGSENVCFHIIPMMNPDGVEIAQSGKLGQVQQEIYDSDLSRGYTTYDAGEYAVHWKANALGIDINRSFDAGWERTDSRPGPSCMLYKGSEPFAAAEAAALRDYTLKYEFAATVSYHAMGSILYYEYGSREDVNLRSRSLAQAVETVTGYPLVGSTGVDAAGYKDWAMEALGIPSVTVEVGCQEVPLALREQYSILERNIRVLSAVEKWVTEA